MFAMPDPHALSFPLLAASAAVAVTHTVLGPDHYLPFLMLAHARRWSRAKTLVITLACGVGHVLSSILLGLAGLALGAGVHWVQKAENARGDWAAWALVAVGAAYTAWGVRVAVRQSAGLGLHEHGGHVHLHVGGGHHHHHPAPSSGDASAFWALFIVFVLGPCEPLVPLFLLPASRGDWPLATATGVTFGLCTIACMAALVLVGQAGLGRLPVGPLQRWAHAVAGAVVTATGLAVILFGL